MAYDNFSDLALNATLTNANWDNGANNWTAYTYLKGDGAGNAIVDGNRTYNANMVAQAGQNGFAMFFKRLTGATSSTVCGIIIDAPGAPSSSGPTAGVWAQVLGNSLRIREIVENITVQTTIALVDNQQYCLEVVKTSDPSNLEYKANLYNATNQVRGSLISTVTLTIGTALSESNTRACLTSGSSSSPYISWQRVESVPLEPASLPTGTITNQPAPNGQKQRFVGTTTNATGGTVSVAGSNGGTNVPAMSFAVASNVFDFEVDLATYGDYIPTLTVTGDGGTAGVTGTQSFSILGVGGGGNIPAPESVPAVAPSAPTGVIASAGDGEVTLNATAPFDGGSPITGYEAFASTGQSATSATLPMTFAMPNGVAATFQLRAINSVGPGPLSAASNSVTPQANVSVPGAPSVSATAGNGSITVEVTAPISNGGAPIISYTVTLSTGENLTQPNGPFVFNNLSLVARTATARATNSSGTGPASAPSNSVTPTQVLSAPSAPQNPVATAGPQTVTLTYLPPENDGGSPVLEYLGTLSTGETSTSTTTTMTFTGVSANVARTATVAARNQTGTGPSSVASNSVTPTDPVPVVTGVSIIPTTVTLEGGSVFQFTGIVHGTFAPSQSLLWSSNGGTIDVNGLFTAPAASIISQQYAVTATSAADPDFSATCIVSVPAEEDSPTLEGVPMRHYVSNITNKFGVAIEGAFITVTNNDTGEKAQLWRDKEKVESLDNPIVTNDEGLVDFYVEAAQCSYHVKGPGITPYTREDIFDIIHNVDLSPINRALVSLNNSKISAAELQAAVTPLAPKSDISALRADLNDVIEQIPNIGSRVPVDVHEYVSGGAGTAASPWTGWDTAIAWAAGTQYDFRDGYYAYQNSPNFARNFLRLNTRANTVFVHTGTGVALNVDAGTSLAAVVVGLDINVRVKSHTGAQGGMIMRGVAQSKIKVEFNDVPGVCVQEISCVLNECEYSTSPTQRGRTFAATTLLTTGRRTGGIGCAGNKYRLLAENLSGVGIALDSCTDSQFEGASQYNDIGVSSTASCLRNSFIGFVTSRNKTEDFRWYGDDCSFTDMKVAGSATFGGKRARVVGGAYDHINVTGQNSHFSCLTYGTNQGRFNEGASGVTRANLYNASTLSFDLDQGRAIDYLTVLGKAIFGTDTFSVGEGQIVKNPAGQVMFGTSAANGAARVQLYNPMNTATDINFRSTVMDNAFSSTAYHLVCQTGGSEVLRINGLGNVVNANNSYGAISDENLKQNIVDATPKLTDLMNVRVVNYELIGDPTAEKLLGVVAQELESVFPGLVENSVDNEGTIFKTVKYSVFVPMLIKAIQELNAKVDSL